VHEPVQEEPDAGQVPHVLQKGEEEEEGEEIRQDDPDARPEPLQRPAQHLSRGTGDPLLHGGRNALQGWEKKSFQYAPHLKYAEEEREQRQEHDGITQNSVHEEGVNPIAEGSLRVGHAGHILEDPQGQGVALGGEDEARFRPSVS